MKANGNGRATRKRRGGLGYACLRLMPIPHKCQRYARARLGLLSYLADFCRLRLGPGELVKGRTLKDGNPSFAAILIQRPKYATTGVWAAGARRAYR